MVYISLRSRNTPPSPIRRLSHLARGAVERGVIPYHLNIGQPDITCPEQFSEGIARYATSHIPYAPSDGLPDLRDEWARWIDGILGVQTSPERYLITMGASEGLEFLFTAVCYPGDEILTFDPTYANYLGFAAQTGVRLVSLESSFEEEFSLPENSIITKHLTSRTRAILLCNPNNPTGILYDKSDIERLLNLCREHELYLIMDETYREIVFDGRPLSSGISVACDDPHLVVVDSLSKRFSLCGARIGALYVPHAELRQKLLYLAQARLSAPIIAQHAATYMLREVSFEYLAEIRQVYQSRRNCMVEELRAIDGVSCSRSQGAFYLLVNLPVEDAEDFARFLLEEYEQDGRTLFVAPARGFYSVAGKGASEIRLAYVLEEPSIRDAISILKGGLAAYGTI
ncbi:MAG: pyridoxal phosphate-dependent aminotransferase [Bdellovibrionota bacterium]